MIGTSSMKALLKLGASRDFAIAKAATVTICTLIVGYGAFLFIFNSAFFHAAGTDAAARQASQGKLTVVTGDGTICYRTLFDNRSSNIVRVERGACREPSAEGPNSRDADGPLGSIRKALNGK